MARPNRDAIDTFMSITGSSEEVAIQRLEEHNGDLNIALDAHFNEADVNNIQAAPVSAAENDMMDIDDPVEIVTQRSPSLFSGTGGSGFSPWSPFSLLDPEFTNRLFDHSLPFNTTSDARQRRPVVSHPREVREIPIEVKDGNSSSTRSGHGPAIVDVTDTELAHGPEIRGTVTIEDGDTDTESDSHSHHTVHTDQTYSNCPRSSAPAFDAAPYDGNDIEEEMLRAAIEASKKDAKLQIHHDLSTDVLRDTRPNLRSDELSRSVSLSLKDEYFESLQADREKELKALEEERIAKQTALAEERRIEEEARLKSEDEQELERHLAAKEASLPPEPSADADNVVTLLVRMPDGSRLGRRFLRSDQLQSLYDFIDIGRSVKPGTYRVVRPYPRRPFSAQESRSTLNDLGLTSKQEALYLEPI